MTFSERTNDLILDINSYCNGKLKNIFELSFLIEISHSEFKESEFDDIIFTAKYINGLFNVIKTNINTGLVNDSIKSEYSASLNSFKQKLKSLVSNTQLEPSFNSKFLGLSQDNMMSLIEFIEDLSYVKEFFNSKKFI